MVKDAPDFQVTVVVNTVPTSDNPDWQVTAVGPGGSAVIGPNPATSVTGPDSYSSPAVVGTSLAYARQDHDHGLPAAGGGSGGLLAIVQYAPYITPGPPYYVEYTTHSLTPVAVDATNLTVSFTAPASGKVLVKLTCGAVECQANGYWELLDHTTDAQYGYSAFIGSNPSAGFETPVHMPIYVTGLTPGDVYQMDWAWHAQVNAYFGTPTVYMWVQDNSPTNYTYGPMLMEVWPAI